MIKKGSTVTWHGDGGRHQALVGLVGTVQRVNNVEALVKFGLFGTGLKDLRGVDLATSTCWCPISGLSEKRERHAEWE